MSEGTVVAIGCSKKLDYAFLLPLSCLFWRDLVGHEPLPMLVGDEREWLDGMRTRRVVAALRERGFEPKFVGRAEGYPDHTMAQNCRQHAAALAEIDGDTWVMPSDADLWPLVRDFYHLHYHARGDRRAVSYYSNGDHFVSKEDVLEKAARGLGSKTLPTCHLAMRARDWRELYDYVPGDVAASVRRTLDGWYPSRRGHDPKMDLWMSDQQMMTERVCAVPWFPDEVGMLEREGHPPLHRLDRARPHWPKFEAGQWTDAHVHREPWTLMHWSDELQLVKALLPQHAAWAAQYRTTFIAGGA